MAHTLAKVYSAELEGIDARLIDVEVDLNVGLHSFQIVGLADKALSEAKERVNSALKNIGVKSPNRENRKITVNLAPADIKKTGSQYDLAIAVGYLLATGQIKNFETSDKLFVGELSLDGSVRAIPGALSIAELSRGKKVKYLYLPKESAPEASVVKEVHVVSVGNLKELISFLESESEPPRANAEEKDKVQKNSPDFGEVRGNEHAKRAMMIAAAGGHNLLMVGSPGVGKSFLAKALTGILPDLSREEAVEITKIYSAAGLSRGELIQERPFRAPHQTASLIAIVGGGSEPRPGEISLAHRGILFLDELPEFQRNVLEALRQPIETGSVHIARAKNNLIFPSIFTLIAAMNPCPCGFYGDDSEPCKCTPYETAKYQKKISGPLLDRIDIQIRIPRITLKELRTHSGEKSESLAMKQQIEKARKIQEERLAAHKIHTNSEMSAKLAEKYASLDAAGEKFLESLHGLNISPRGYYRMLKTARTIADLDGSERVKEEHLAEAFNYRLRNES